MYTKKIIASALIMAVALMAATPTLGVSQEARRVAKGFTFEGLPEGFIPPPLHPAGVELETQKLADGVYALVSNHPAVDNSGFIVGKRGVLVIDAHINGEMAQQILDAVRRVTDKPILYLVNTNYHGDHTFGNYKFPSTTTIIAHHTTAQRMTHFEDEKELLLATVQGDASVFADVELRLPDVVFDRFTRVDLGGRVVELHHFGPGNTPGDVVVYEPGVRVAWTGNLIVGAGTIPPMFEYGAATYLETLTRFGVTLDITTIVPGHGPMTDGAILTRYLGYVTDLLASVRRAVRQGKSLDQVLAGVELGAPYLPPADTPFAQFLPFVQGIHQVNVMRTYEEESARL